MEYKKNQKKFIPPLKVPSARLDLHESATIGLEKNINRYMFLFF